VSGSRCKLGECRTPGPCTDHRNIHCGNFRSSPWAIR
jgi:hypothetical protein